MRTLTVAALSASPHEPSKTTALLDTVMAAFREATPLREERLLMTEIAPALGQSLTRDGVGDAAKRALDTVEGCDLLVVTTPIYRATYTGMFKHFFDLVGQDALVGTPVFLSAIGGNLSHALSIDHQLRPLFAFFRAVALPEGVFAEGADFSGHQPGEPLQRRARAAVERAMPLVECLTGE